MRTTARRCAAIPKNSSCPSRDQPGANPAATRYFARVGGNGSTKTALRPVSCERYATHLPSGENIGCGMPDVPGVAAFPNGSDFRSRTARLHTEYLESLSTV